MARPAAFDESLNKYGLFDPSLTGPGFFDKSLTFLPPHKFPEVFGTPSTYSGDSLTTHSIPFTGSEYPGVLLIAFFVTKLTPTPTWPSGWTNISGFPSSAGSHYVSGRYHICDGTEAGSFDITLDAAQRACGLVYAIRKHGSSVNPPEGTTATSGVSTKPDPPTLAPSAGGRRDFLWFAFEGSDNAGSSVTTFPDAYLNPQQVPSLGTPPEGVCLGAAQRQIFVATENPGTFTIALSEDWISNTVAVYPGSEADLNAINSYRRCEYPADAWWFQPYWDVSFWTVQNPPRAPGAGAAPQNQIARREYPDNPWWWEVRTQAESWLQSPLAKSNATAFGKREYPEHHWWFDAKRDIFAETWTATPRPGNRQARQGSVEFPRDVWWWLAPFEGSHLGSMFAPRPANVVVDLSITVSKREYPKDAWWWEPGRVLSNEGDTRPPLAKNRVPQSGQRIRAIIEDGWWWLPVFDPAHLGFTLQPRPANVVLDASITISKREYPKDAWWWEYGRVLWNDLELRWPTPKNRVAQSGQRIRTFPEDEWWFRHILPPDVELRWPPPKNRQNQTGQRIRSLPEEEWWPRTPLESGFTFFPSKIPTTVSPRLPRPEYPIDPWWFERVPTIPSQQGQVREPQPSHCCTFGSPILYTAANWGVGVSIYFEVYMRAIVGTAHARLFDRTGNAPVAGSEVVTTSLTNIRLRSGPLTLTDGREYISQFCVTGADALAAKGARLVVV